MVVGIRDLIGWLCSILFPDLAKISVSIGSHSATRHCDSYSMFLYRFLASVNSACDCGPECIHVGQSMGMLDVCVC